MSGALIGAEPFAEIEAEDSFFALVERGQKLLERERQIFFSGDYGELGTLSERKLETLREFESMLPGLRRSAAVVEALERLISDSRRNEEIIRAARQGLAHAKRRIAAILEAGRGAVAYAEDGSRIASKADMLHTQKSA